MHQSESRCFRKSALLWKSCRPRIFLEKKTILFSVVGRFQKFNALKLQMSPVVPYPQISNHVQFVVSYNFFWSQTFLLLTTSLFTALQFTDLFAVLHWSAFSIFLVFHISALYAISSAWILFLTEILLYYKFIFFSLCLFAEFFIHLNKSAVHHAPFGRFCSLHNSSLFRVFPILNTIHLSDFHGLSLYSILNFLLLSFTLNIRMHLIDNWLTDYIV